jgi:Zn-dependent protease
MLGLKEIISVIIATIVLGFVVSFPASWNSFFIALVLVFIMLGVNILAKKAAAYFFDCSAETGIWSFQRYWYYKGAHLKKPFPIGVVLPILLSLISLGKIMWFAVAEFDLTPLSSKATKRHGLYRYSEVTEWNFANIAAIALIANLILAAIGYIIGNPLLNFAKWNIFFVLFNLLPVGNLDGRKILMGSRVLWFGLLIITVIFTAYVFLLV